MSDKRNLRFSILSILKTFTFFSLLFVVILQYFQARNLREQVRLLQYIRVLPTASASGISYVEVVRQNEDGSTYINKVYIAKDGRKRSESITSKHSTISVYDDWGLHRVVLRPKTKTATEFAEVEEFGRKTTRVKALAQVHVRGRGGNSTRRSVGGEPMASRILSIIRNASCTSRSAAGRTTIIFTSCITASRSAYVFTTTFLPTMKPSLIT